jgi:hypothetical protein
MSEVIVDVEKLTYGLERGIGDVRNIFARAPVEQRLRLSPCGMVSSAIHQYAMREGLPSQLMISSPNLSFNPEWQHTIPVIGEGNDQVVIDAAISRLFTATMGMTVAYEEKIKWQKTFPEEKIIVFSFSERGIVCDWMAEVADMFRRRSVEFRNAYHMKQGTGPISRCSTKEIRDVFAKMWNPANMAAWVPMEDVWEDGRVVSRHLPKEAITLL